MNMGNVALAFAQFIIQANTICEPGHKFGDMIGKLWNGRVHMALGTQIQIVDMLNKTLSMGVMGAANRKETYERWDGAAVGCLRADGRG